MKNKFLQFIFIVTLIFITTGSVFSATISLIPSKVSVFEGETFSATVSVNTQGVAVNNVEGVVSFPANLVSVESVNLNGSIFSIWIEQPVYSNANGTITFNGGAPNPGYTGSNGTIMRIVFRAKKTGVVPLAFASGEVYANDGLGTNVTTGRIASPTIQIVAKKVIDEEPEETREFYGKVPDPLIIRSQSLPDSDSWHNTKKITFEWDLPSGATGVQLGWGKNPTSAPTVLYSPAVKEKTIESVPDGEWYIHGRVRNNAGWSSVTHHKFKVDTTAPKDLKVETKVTSNDQIEVYILANDVISGINRYEVTVDSKKFDGAPQEKNGYGKILLPLMKEGEYELDVSAFDNAGNIVSEKIIVHTPRLRAPVITDYPQTIYKNDLVSIKGKTYPNVNVSVTSEYSSLLKEVNIVNSNESGDFNYDFVNTQKQGLIKVYAEFVDSKDSLTEKSATVTIEIKRSGFFFEILAVLMSVKTGVINIIVSVLILILVIVISVGFYKFYRLHKKLSNDVEDLRDAIMKKDTTPEAKAALRKIVKDLE